MSRTAVPERTSIAFETKNHLPEKVRAEIIELFNQRLADAIDLELITKQAHWNVKGPQFIALHRLFDEIHESADEYVDLIAERIVQLGGVAHGTIHDAARQTELTPYPEDIFEGPDHVEALANALAEFGDHLRKAAELAEKAEDQESMDICVEISRGVDKWLWFVEAHNQEHRNGKSR